MFPLKIYLHVNCIPIFDRQLNLGSFQISMLSIFNDRKRTIAPVVPETIDKGKCRYTIFIVRPNIMLVISVISMNRRFFRCEINK